MHNNFLSIGDKILCMGVKSLFFQVKPCTVAPCAWGSCTKPYCAWSRG